VGPRVGWIRRAALRLGKSVFLPSVNVGRVAGLVCHVWKCVISLPAPMLNRLAQEPPYCFYLLTSAGYKLLHHPRVFARESANGTPARVATIAPAEMVRDGAVGIYAQVAQSLKGNGRIRQKKNLRRRSRETAFFQKFHQPKLWSQSRPAVARPPLVSIRQLICFQLVRRPFGTRQLT